MKGRLILASQSPRRRELMALAGLSFDVRPSGDPEIVTENEPARIVQELARAKAHDVLAGAQDGDIVIGADTIVVQDGKVLGKPSDPEDAHRMLARLSGRTHQVFTGVCVCEKAGKETVFAEETCVSVCPLTEEEIGAYIATGEPMDKAGAYGVQGAFCRYVDRIDGDYYNVVGLPVARLYHVLRDWDRHE